MNRWIANKLVSWSGLLCCLLSAASQAPAAQPARVLSIEGTAEIQRAGTTNWQVAQVSQLLAAGDRLRVGQHARVAVQFSDRSVERLAPGTTTTFEPSPTNSAARSFRLEGGRIFFKSSERPGEIRFRTGPNGGTASAAIRGTEFVVDVAPDGRTVLTLIEGEVDIENAAGALSLRSGDMAVITPGQAPLKSPALQTRQAIQWCLYYPGVLALEEVPFTDAQRITHSQSLRAWQQGALPRALTTWDAARAPADDTERVYRAALLLTVGEVAAAEGLLIQTARANHPRLVELTRALRTLIAAVRFEALPESAPPTTASEWLALSYWHQSRSDLRAARVAAREAATRAPDFGLAHARVAELEFSFGDARAARLALEQALTLAPQNAQAVSLRGFVAAAEGRLADAELDFEAAMALDGALANAWLGRGLVRIRRGEIAAGRADLQAAAAFEPNRAVLRSYLGKAFQTEGDRSHAARELNLAKQLDPGDPTAWLYSALLAGAWNELNPAVRDLERSLTLNTNRSLFRSGLLLDQDRAVRGANLANLYRDVRMTDVAISTAARAVASDFANHSAHLFLANSYAVLREARPGELRFETPALNELLLANLLAPPGSPVLSSTISQQEYSRLFEQNHASIFSATEYRSGGDWSQTASQFGLQDGLSWSLDYTRASQNGDQPNGGFERDSYSAGVKLQFTPRDSLFVQALHAHNRAGDLTTYYDPASAKTGVRLKEVQEPTLLAGWHREWAPGNHTLLFAGRVEDQLNYTDPAYAQLLLARTAGGDVFAVGKPASPSSSLSYSANFTLHTAEMLQILQRERHTLIFGVRYQVGTFDTASQLTASTPTRIGDEAGLNPGFQPFPSFFTSATNQTASLDFDRLSLYAYEHYSLRDDLRLIGGITYDDLKLPQNHLFPPTADTLERSRRVSPKAGIVWTPHDHTTVRFGFSRAASGVSFDQSFRLEPSEVAGFNQSFRSVIPDSVAGTTANAAFENFGLSLNQSFATGTYLTLAAGRLTSDLVRRVGTFNLVLPPSVASSTPQELRYREHTLLVALNQLLGEQWFAGARYELSDAQLQDDFPEIPASVATGAHTIRAATLHHAALHLGLHHPSGFFARAEADWYAQSNRGFNAAAMPGDDFFQANLHTGWRFARRRAELQLSVLNLAGQDYRLNPLNLYASLPRERTLAVRLKLAF